MRGGLLGWAGTGTTGLDNLRTKPGEDPAWFLSRAKERRLTMHGELLKRLNADRGRGPGQAHSQMG